MFPGSSWDWLKLQHDTACYHFITGPLPLGACSGFSCKSTYLIEMLTECLCFNVLHFFPERTQKWYCFPDILHPLWQITQWVSTSSGMLLYHTALPLLMLKRVRTCTCVSAIYYSVFILLPYILTVYQASNEPYMSTVHSSTVVRCRLVCMLPCIFTLATVLIKAPLSSHGGWDVYRKKEGEKMLFCCLLRHAFTWWWWSLE